MKLVANSGHNILFCQEGKILKTDRLLAVSKKRAGGGIRSVNRGKAGGLD